VFVSAYKSVAYSNKTSGPCNFTKSYLGHVSKKLKPLKFQTVYIKDVKWFPMHQIKFSKSITNIFRTGFLPGKKKRCGYQALS